MNLSDIKVCICGGGNIGHSLVAAFARNGDVGVLTRRPDAWSDRLHYQIADGAWQETEGRVVATRDPGMVQHASLIVIALPRFAIDEELSAIEQYLHPGQAIVFVPAPGGLEKIVERVGCRGVEVIGFQRVPFISRIKEYGQSVVMGSVRPVSKLALSDNGKTKVWKKYFESTIGGEIEFLSSFLSFTFSNSNPLLHPARLVELLRKKEGYSRCPYFYAEWGDEASELYVAADAEMKVVFAAFSPEAMRSDYKSALEHYEVNSVHDLTKKIRSIKSLSEILAPYRKDADGLWRPDFMSRYFTEDVPYGTSIIKSYAKRTGVPTPTIDFLIETISLQG